MLSSPPRPELATMLRESTTEAHHRAETSQFMDELSNGNVPFNALADYHAQLFYLYQELEASVRKAKEHPAIAAVADPRLERTEALNNDLKAMAGLKWRDTYPALPATAAYGTYLKHLAAQRNGYALVAHHYVRYLGDLSGGQVISRRLADHYSLGPEARRFYDFSTLGKIKPYRDRYRAQLNAIELNNDQCATVIEEAQRAFDANGAIFADLHSKYISNPNA